MGHSHGTKWTDEAVKQGVTKIVTALELDRMPTRKECVDYCGNSALACQISRRPGGWYALAEELGLPTKSSETQTGKTHEMLVCKMLEERGFAVEKMSQNFPYDILVDNGVKVDVKASHLYRGKMGDFFSFNLEKKRATCDIYILVALSDENRVIDTFVVPSNFVMANTQISIGKTNSKYHKFRNKWEYISMFSAFLGNLPDGSEVG